MDDRFAPIRELFDVSHIERTVRLLVLGAGRVGYWFSVFAVSHGVRWLRVIDPDWTTLRNFASGFHECAVGRPKVDYMRDEMRRRSPRISFKGAATRLAVEDHGVFLDWLPEATHVAFFLDSFQVASFLARIAYPQVPCLYAAVLEHGTTGEVAWSFPQLTPCLECSARLSEKRGAPGGQTALVDVISVVNLAVRQFLGLALIDRPGYEHFAPYLDPRYCLTYVVNRPGGHVETGLPHIPAAIRPVEVVDGHGQGPSCPCCSGYRP